MTFPYFQQHGAYFKRIRKGSIFLRTALKNTPLSKFSTFSKYIHFNGIRVHIYFILLVHNPYFYFLGLLKVYSV